MLIEQSGNVISGDEFRRRKLMASEATVQFLNVGGLVLDRFSRILQVPGELVDGQWIEAQRLGLTELQSKILEVLIRNAPKAVHRDVLLVHAWGMTDGPRTDRVDVAMTFLRRKIGRKVIETVRGAGYRIREVSA